MKPTRYLLHLDADGPWLSPTTDSQTVCYRILRQRVGQGATRASIQKRILSGPLPAALEQVALTLRTAEAAATTAKASANRAFVLYHDTKTRRQRLHDECLAAENEVRTAGEGVWLTAYEKGAASEAMAWARLHVAVETADKARRAWVKGAAASERARLRWLRTEVACWSANDNLTEARRAWHEALVSEAGLAFHAEVCGCDWRGKEAQNETK